MRLRRVHIEFIKISESDALIKTRRIRDILCRALLRIEEENNVQQDDSKNENKEEAVLTKGPT